MLYFQLSRIILNIGADESMNAHINSLFKNGEEVIAYIEQHMPQLGQAADLSCMEIGDGNLNFIYRVKNKRTGESVIVKQAGDFARSTQEYKLTIDRNRIEAEVLGYYGTIADGLVPKVYRFDDERHCYLMEDLGSYEILRKFLMERKTSSLLSDQITTFLVKILLQTSDLSMEHMQKREMVKRYSNPELCKISEDLVFTDPFTNAGGTNAVFPPNADFLRHMVFEDTALHLEAAKLKYAFMNQSEALIHGDLHTGSVFIREDGIKIIDPEFAFYGPAGYDAGNVIGNLVFAWVNAKVVMEPGRQKDAYMTWLEKTISEVVDLYAKKFLDWFPDTAGDVMAFTPGFPAWYLSGILEDTAGMAGLEMIRRVVGEAGVEEIRGISDTSLRLIAEQTVIRIGKQFILKRSCLKTGKDYLAVIRQGVM